MMKFAIATLCLLVSHVCGVVIQLEHLPEQCNLSKCTQPDSNKVNVHLVPHTHDDVGWLKTVDQYYYGSQTHYQKAGVQYILDTVVQELIQNKDRRFIYVETAFFWKWWKEQDNKMRDVVRELVQTGQLEFINGGWCMNDEATTHYNSIIDQMSWGLRRLNDTFGHCGVPKVTWQIDPFGHSKELANLFAQMNYDAVYFAREDYQDHGVRAAERRLEHVWQASEELGTAGDLFTGMLHMGYGPPRRLNWDMVGGGDEPVIDNVESEEYNVPKIVSEFVNNAKDYAKNYATKNILYPVGTDFQFMDAHIYYKNLDKLIKHVNEMQKEVKVFYSTPSCYTKAVQDSCEVFTAKNDDYFPYASDPHAYWTGYFSSRPALKRMERYGNNVLQACKQVDVLAGNKGLYEKNVTKLREIMGVMQHHDAVAGTEKQHVTNDYAKNLQIGIEHCQHVLSNSYKKILSKTSKSNLFQVFCNNLNISSCDFTESFNGDFVVTIYNPLGHTVFNQSMRIPVNPKDFYEVYCPEGKLIDAVLVHVPDYVQKLSERRSVATQVLTFSVDSIPPLGFVSYTVKRSTAKKSHSAPVLKSTKIVSPIKVKSKNFELLFDGAGQLTNFILSNGEKVSFTNDFELYKGHDGDNSKFEKRASGAYIFRPAEQKTFKAAKLTESNLYVDSKTGVNEIHQKFDSFIEQVIRVNPQSDAVEFEFVVGPIPVDDKIGKEIVARYSSDLKSNGTFYTDSNGRQMLKRQVNHRPTWKLNVTEPVAGNYYPVTSRIFIRDEKRNLQLTVLNDRAQGGSSLVDGGIELMVHRRLLHDDAFGVGEALNEPGTDGKGLVIRGRHVVLLDTIKNSAPRHRPLAQQMFMEPIVSFAAHTEHYDKEFKTKYSGLKRELPANVHLLTLEQWNSGRYLLRLEHFYQLNEDPVLSKPVTVDLKDLFTSFTITGIQELTLGANQDVSALKNRLKFKYTPSKAPVSLPPTSANVESLKIELNPMQIRTFVLNIQHKH